MKGCECPVATRCHGDLFFLDPRTPLDPPMSRLHFAHHTPGGHLVGLRGNHCVVSCQFLLRVFDALGVRLEIHEF